MYIHIIIFFFVTCKIVRIVSDRKLKHKIRACVSKGADEDKSGYCFRVGTDQGLDGIGHGWFYTRLKTIRNSSSAWIRQASNLNRTMIMESLTWRASTYIDSLINKISGRGIDPTDQCDREDNTKSSMIN